MSFALPARLRPGLLLCLAMLLPACQGQIPPKSAAYGRDPAQSLDIYMPGKGDSPHPVVILIHGGAYLEGDKRDFADIARGLADQGWVAISLNYRLTTTGATWPDIRNDIIDATQWVGHHADDLHIDRNRVTIMGASAGGQLAAWMATTDYISKDQIHTRPKCLIDIAGPWDFTATGDVSEPAQTAINRLIAGGDPKAASPLFLIDSATSATLLIHGTHDDTVSINQSRMAYARLQAAHVRATLLELPGEGHMAIKTDANKQLFSNTLTSFIRTC